MWKKLIVLCIALLGTFSVAYAYYNMEMDATTDTTLAVAANLKSAEYPSGRTGDIISQKFIIGTYDDTPILFDVVKTGITNDLGESSGTGALLTSNQIVGTYATTYSGFSDEAISGYNQMNASLNEAEKNYFIIMYLILKWDIFLCPLKMSRTISQGLIITSGN